MHTIIDTKQINSEIIRDLAAVKADKVRYLKRMNFFENILLLVGTPSLFTLLGVGFINTPETLPNNWFSLLILSAGIFLSGILLMMFRDTTRDNLIEKFSKTLTSNEITAEYPKYFDKVTKELKERIAKNEFDKEVLDSELQAYKAAQEDIMPE